MVVATAIACATLAVFAQPGSALRPVADHHAHLQSKAAWQLFHEVLPTVTPPPEVARVLTDFERGWQSLDKSFFAALFTEEGLLQWGDDWARGRRAIRNALLGKAGGLRMRAQAFETHDSLGFIAGMYGFYRDTTWVDQGRYALTLRRTKTEPWQIAVAFLSNTTTTTPPPAGDPVTADNLIAELDSAGVRRAAVLSLAYQFGAPSREQMGDEQAKTRAENDWVAQQVARYPARLAGFCSVHALATYALEELNRCVALPNMAGIKLHFTNSDVDLRNPAHLDQIRAIFRMANARRVPIVAHIRTLDATYGRRDSEIFLRDVLSQAPDIPVQLAHMAGWGGYGDETDAALSVFAEALAAGDARTVNLYFDVSQVVTPGLPVERRQLLVQRMRQIGMTRILFGVDGGDTYEKAWQNLKLLPLDDAELRVIAGNLAPYLR